MNGLDKEALRQQMLLRALWGDARPGVVSGWLRDGPRAARGLAAYRANAGAVAERALAVAYPTVQQLLGEEAFAALARALWRAHPPLAGDLGQWGSELARFMATAESLAGEPYLPDVARLEWAVHSAERAADAPAPQGLPLLAEAEPHVLQLELAPGTALLVSPHPIVSIWQAHRAEGAARFDGVRAAMAAGRGETALVSRVGWRPEVSALPEAAGAFVQAVLDGQPLAAALDAAGPDFDFETWLIAALQQRLLVGVQRQAQWESTA